MEQTAYYIGLTGITLRAATDTQVMRWPVFDKNFARPLGVICTDMALSKGWNTYCSKSLISASRRSETASSSSLIRASGLRTPGITPSTAGRSLVGARDNLPTSSVFPHCARSMDFAAVVTNRYRLPFRSRNSRFLQRIPVRFSCSCSESAMLSMALNNHRNSHSVDRGQGLLSVVHL